MSHDLYSNKEFTSLKEQLNKEIQRRGTYSWWDPLVPPSVGEERTPPLTLPEIGKRMVVSDETYTINTPSENALERTRNINYPAQGDNPGGTSTDSLGIKPNSSALRFDVDEAKNFLVGLSKIRDIKLFYGRDEKEGIGFRETKGIYDALEASQASELNAPLHKSDISPNRIDPLTGLEITYPLEMGQYVMPSGQTDGEQLYSEWGPDETNFFDDHGASIVDTGEKTIDGQPILVSDSNFHPLNPNISPLKTIHTINQDRNRKDIKEDYTEGGLSASRFGQNPRNPNPGNRTQGRSVFGGVVGACQVACTGLCYKTCDNECSESCSTTCWNRCGEACTSTCGNVCTGCNTMCYTSCRTRCENSTGFSCFKSGAVAVKIIPVGYPIGSSGEPGGDNWPKNTVTFTTYSCNGCAYTCQFWPNKRTSCWDAACQELCFTSCRNYCSTSCFGGCIDNASENTGYKTGKGRGCSSACTVNCVGNCHATCDGECINTCWHACKALCYDNCSWECHTNCGSGCANNCRQGCMGCHATCQGSCKDKANSSLCAGCGWGAGCTSTCQHDCNKNCIGWGCRSICGIDSAGACEANCRLNCMAHSCTSMCSDACSDHCTACVNTCGFQCGPCTSQCSIGCGAECNIYCTDRCMNACDTYCYMNCTDVCGGCSDLCYSCVGKCIGVCSVKCENGCSSCTMNCGFWCDTSCNRACFNNCDDRCIKTCQGWCVTFLQANTSAPLTGPDRNPTSEGYKYYNPKNREEEQESFRIIENFHLKNPSRVPARKFIIRVRLDKERNLEINYADGYDFRYLIKQCVIRGGVWQVNDAGEISVVMDSLEPVLEQISTVDDGNNPNAIYVVVCYNPDKVPVQESDIITRLPFGWEHQSILLDEHILIVISVSEVEPWVE